MQLGAGTSLFCLFQCAIPFCILLVYLSIRKEKKRKEKKRKRNINIDLAILPSHNNPFYL